MDEREAFAAYFENQHTRKFPRRGTTGTQMREALSAFQAGVAYAEMLATTGRPIRDYPPRVGPVGPAGDSGAATDRPNRSEETR